MTPSPSAQAYLLQRALELGALDKVVVRLQRLVARHALPRAGPQRLAQARGRVVRCADSPDLALLDQLRERPERLVERRGRVVAVRLVEVDMVGLQPPQRISAARMI